MNDVSQHVFFDSGSVVWDVRSSGKYDAIREIIHRSPVLGSINKLDPDEFAEIVIQREKLQTTGFGHGVAVAHGRSPAIEDSEITLGVSKEGIDYDAVDGHPVHLLFIVANHPDKQMDYLTILSSLVSLVRHASFREELLSCMCQEEIEEKLSQAFHRVIKNRTIA